MPYCRQHLHRQMTNEGVRPAPARKVVMDVTISEKGNLTFSVFEVGGEMQRSLRVDWVKTFEDNQLAQMRVNAA